MRGVRRGSARPQRHAAHRAEHDQPDLGDRCLNDTGIPGDEINQHKRKRTEEPFGWAKIIGGLARPMLRRAASLRFKSAVGTNFSGLLGVRPARCLIRLGRQQVKYQLPALSRFAVDARLVASLGWWARFRAETAYWPRFLSGLTFGTTTVRRKASQFSGDS